MTSYVESLADKNIRPNIVIKIKGNYYSSHQPDSGLVIDSDKNGLVKSLVINPTTVDVARPSTTISNISFSLLDKGGVISYLFLNQDNYLNGEEVEVYLGRIGLEMDFSKYYLLPRCYISRSQKNDGAWNFNAEERKDRINRAAFSGSTKLGSSILAATTTITVQDVTKMRASGLVKIDNEFISYSGRDLANNYLTGCIRGERNTTPSTHDLGADVFQADEVIDNPINILLKLLISSGGGGSYDALIDGAGISQTLIDIAQIEEVRDQICPEAIFDLALSNIESLQEFIENEILYPLGLRLRTNSNAKIGLAVLNRTYLDVDTIDLNHDNITKNPIFDVVDSKVFNKIRVLWDYSDDQDQYLKVHDTSDLSSIATYGERILEIKLKGPRETSGGLGFVQDVADQFLKRLYLPRPEITLGLQMQGSTALIGDKINFDSDLVIDIDTGLLGLKKDLEVISRSINHQTSDVQTKLSFTWYSGMRQCFISPTDKIVSVVSQSRATIAIGRSGLYRRSWVMRVWDDVVGDYASTEINTIKEIVGDDLVFSNAWTTPLTTNIRFKFADYDQVTEQQKKFCFIGDGGNFSDGQKSYQITT